MDQTRDSSEYGTQRYRNRRSHGMSHHQDKNLLETSNQLISCTGLCRGPNHLHRTRCGQRTGPSYRRNPGCGHCKSQQGKVLMVL